MAYIQQGDTLDMTTEKTGTQGVLYIEDTGSYVHLGIRCKDPNYTKTKLSFSWKAPTGSGTINNWTLPSGGGLIPIRSFALGVSGDIAFTLKATGTTELGGPTTVTKKVSRSEDTPEPPIITEVVMTSATSARVTWNMRESLTGGSNIKNFDVGYSPTAWVAKGGTIIENAATASNYGGTRTITGLKPNTFYYVWVRSKNAKGTSPWSPAKGILTSGGVMIRYMNEWRNAIPYVKVDGVWKPARAYVKRNDAWGLTR